MTLYVRQLPGGSWAYMKEPPTDPNEPVITKEMVKAKEAEAAAQKFAELTEKYGHPSIDQEGMRTFYDREGFERTYYPSGGFFSLGRVDMDQFDINQKRQIMKFYKARDDVNRDPSFTPEERQIANAEIQEQLNAITPHRPVDKEPTVEELFQQRSYVDPKTGRHFLMDSKGDFKDVTPDDPSTSAEFQLELREKKLKFATDLVRTYQGTDSEMSFEDAFEQAEKYFGESPQSEDVTTKKQQLPGMDQQWRDFIQQIKENQQQFIADLYLYLDRKQLEDLKVVLATGDDQLIFEALTSSELQQAMAQLEER
jgi:hypothetical protein